MQGFSQTDPEFTYSLVQSLIDFLFPSLFSLFQGCEWKNGMEGFL